MTAQKHQKSLSNCRKSWSESGNHSWVWKNVEYGAAVLKEKHGANIELTKDNLLLACRVVCCSAKEMWCVQQVSFVSREYAPNTWMAYNSMISHLHMWNKECWFGIFGRRSMSFKDRADPRLAPNQWKMALLCNAVSHCLGADLESTL